MENGSKLFFENSLAGMDKSVLSTVKITDYPDSGHANPEPVSDYSDEGLEDFLSPQSLVSLLPDILLAFTLKLFKNFYLYIMRSLQVCKQL